MLSVAKRTPRTVMPPLSPYYSAVYDELWKQDFHTTLSMLTFEAAFNLFYLVSWGVIQ